MNIPHWLILSEVYQQAEAMERTLEKIMGKAGNKTAHVAQMKGDVTFKGRFRDPGADGPSGHVDVVVMCEARGSLRLVSGKLIMIWGLF